jgi:hypothetical protein
MKFGRITRNTAIGGEPVAAGEIVEVDEATFKQLRRCNKIEPCELPAGVEPEPVKPAPKLKKHAQ